MTHSLVQAPPEQVATSAPSSLTNEVPLVLRCRVFALAESPPGELHPVASQVESYRRVADARPIRAVGSATLGARAGDGAIAHDFVTRLEAGKLGAFACLGEALGLVTPALRAHFAPTEPPRESEHTNSESWTLVVTHDQHGARAEFRATRWVRQDDPHAPVALASIRRTRSEDVLALTGRAKDQEPLVLTVPWVDGSGSPYTLALVLAARPADTSEHQLLASATTAAESRDRRRQAASRPASRGDVAGVTVVTSWLRLGERPHQRAALEQLAPLCGASLAADVALLADDTTIAHVCARAETLAKEFGARPRETAAAGWLVERACIEELGEQARSGTLAPALDGLLLVHLGELARTLDTVTRGLARMRSLADLRLWLIDEHLAALADRSPSVRMRAHGWLERQELAVPGFDPLGAPAARKDALLRHEEARAERAAKGVPR